MKHSNLYLGLVLPSDGWQSLIGAAIKFCHWQKIENCSFKKGIKNGREATDMKLKHRRNLLSS